MSSRERDLVHGDVIAPGGGLAFRYVVENERPGIGTNLRALGRWVLFDRQHDHWRCVPRASPSDEPWRAIVLRDDVNPVTISQAGLVGGCATSVHGLVQDDDEVTFVLAGDVCGASLEELLREDSGSLDPSVLAAILRPLATTLLQAPRVGCWLQTSSMHVRCDGVVAFDGFLTHALSAIGGEDLARALALVCLSAGLLGPPADEDHLPPLIIELDVENEEPPWARRERAVHAASVALWRQRAATLGALGPVLVDAVDDDGVRQPSLQTLCEAIIAWADAQAPASTAMLAELLTGLFPERMSRERALRDRLAVLDESAIDAMLD